jgi:hypothetical protein
MNLALPEDDVIRSERYRRGANGSPCRFRGPTCNADPATSQFAHANGAAFGKGAMHKAHDIAGIDACSGCHAYIDVGHGTKPLISEAEFWRLIARGIIETIVDRIRRGIVVVPLDPERIARPVKARKPKAERRAVPAGRPLESRSNWPAKGTRKIPTRPTVRRSEA